MAAVTEIGVASGELTGPWTSAFWVTLPFPAQSKSNFRRKERSGWGALASFEDDVASVIAPFRPAAWELGSPHDKVPARPVVLAVVAARTLLDISNLSKSALDALEGILYISDAQVLGCVTVGERGGTNAWFSTAFAQLQPGSSFPEITAATTALTAAWADAATGVPRG